MKNTLILYKINNKLRSHICHNIKLKVIRRKERDCPTYRRDSNQTDSSDSCPDLKRAKFKKTKFVISIDFKW